MALIFLSDKGICCKNAQKSVTKLGVVDAGTKTLIS